jgi:hypothetical protein
MKTIHGLERHRYAPELNKLWYTDETFDRVPSCVTIDEAIQYVANYDDWDLDAVTFVKATIDKKFPNE